MTKDETRHWLEIELKTWEDECKSEHPIKEALRNAIKALEQEPKIGHWIMTNDYLTTAYGSVDYVKCSCCGEDSLEEGNYCPNCGAEMESEVRDDKRRSNNNIRL